MQSKFKFSLDGTDATARQFMEIKRQIQELPPSIVDSVKPMVDQITAMYQEIQTLTSNLDQRVQESISLGMPEDFYSIDLLAAYEALGTITGETVGEDLVNEIFSRFCMGK